VNGVFLIFHARANLAVSPLPKHAVLLLHVTLLDVVVRTKISICKNDNLINKIIKDLKDDCIKLKVTFNEIAFRHFFKVLFELLALAFMVRALIIEALLEPLPDDVDYRAIN
jgi:hypothetical protein